jgi:putative transcriptional regulator
MDSLLRERFARLGPVQVIDRVTSGSPAVFVLRLASDSPHPRAPRPRTIDAIHALARRGLSLLQAKRAIESLLEKGRIFVDLPMVEDTTALTSDLTKAGIAAAWIKPDPTINVRELRECLALTREQFAARYGFEIETLRNWETGKRQPDTTARSYLKAISNAPELIEQAYAPTPTI